MTFSSELCRLGARVLAPLALAAALLTACGGGTEQVQAFKPDRLIVLGDENSMIEDFVDAVGRHDGFKYTVNDRSSTTSGKCLALPNAAQSVAALYGFSFLQCNPHAITPQAFILAARGATVGSVSTGLAAQLQNVKTVTQGNALGARDLVMLLIGGNDIIELYERTLSGLSPADAVAEAQRRGVLAAEQVNAVLATGARALVITTPDLGLSPYAVNANKTNPGASSPPPSYACVSNPGASGLLSRLTCEFNAYLRTSTRPQDGRNWGLVLADDIVAAMFKVPKSFLTAPAVAAASACEIADGLSADQVASAVLKCNTTATANSATEIKLVGGASSGSHLWASDRHIGPSAHSRIGTQAQSRAGTNPF